MSTFQDLIAKLDAFFEEKNEREKTMIIFFPAILILFLSYYYFFGTSSKALQQSSVELEQARSLNKALKTTIKQMESADVQAMLTNKIEETNTKIVKTKDELEGIKAKAVDVEQRQKEWSQVLDFLSRKAKNDKLAIQRIATQKDTNNSNYDVFNAGISGTASFKDALKYLDGIENEGGFLRVVAGRIFYKEGNLFFDLNISARRLKF